MEKPMMTLRTGIRRAKAPAIPLPSVGAMVLAMLLLTALTACGGGSPGDGEDRETSQRPLCVSACPR